MEKPNQVQTNRITIMIPDEVNEQILEFKKTDKFVKSSYSEVVRFLLNKGIKSASKELQKK